MTDDSITRRRYSDQEISQILARAAKLQEAEGQTDLTGGMSVGELEQIASAVGVDPRFVRAAAAELDRGEKPSDRFSLWGGPLSFELEGTADGRVSEEAWASVVQDVRRTFGEVGETSQFGKSLEWAYKQQDIMNAHLTLTPHEGQTRIEVRLIYEAMAFLTFLVAGAGSVLAGLGAVSAVNWSPLIEVPLVGGAAAAGIAFTRLWFGRWTRKQRRKYARLLSRVQGMISEASSASLGEAIASDESFSSDQRESKAAPSRPETRVKAG